MSVTEQMTVTERVTAMTEHASIPEPLQANVGTAAADAITDARQAIADAVTASKALAGRRDDLETEKRFKVPELHQHQLNQATDEARPLIQQAIRRVQENVDAAETHLIRHAVGDGTFPSAGDEANARQLFDLYIGGAEKEQAVARLMNLAQNGDQSVRQVLATPFARVYLMGRGVSDVDKVLRSASEAVVQSDVSITPQVLQAREGLQHLGELQGALQAVGAAFRQALS